jgi:hypothetical protein
VTSSLRTLLHEIIDYAGLFPPAELPLDEAIRRYASHRRSSQAWMLARFIVPVGELDELSPLLDELIRPDETYRFSVLPRGGNDAAGFGAALAEDLEAIAAFRERHGDRVEVDALEARFPTELLATCDSGAMAAFLEDAAALMDAAGPPAVAPFYEAGFANDGWERTLPALVGALGVHARARAAVPRGGVATAPRRAGAAGFKLRCGGVTPDAFPSPEQVAFVIAQCRDHEVPMKLTAGLHHPLRHFNEGQRVTMHGFFNVFTAGIMAWAQKLEPTRLVQILEDESIGGFAFDEDRLSWKGYTVGADELRRLRARAMTSFGSCSFDEPREDLRALGLLPVE